MKANLYISGLMATFAVVAGLVFTGSVSAKTQLGPNDKCVQVAVRGWTCLGGDPLFPGGLMKIAKVQHISMRQAFVFAETSSRGNAAMATSGLNTAQRNAVETAVRRGQFTSCPLRYGETFLHMSYGINGTSVDNGIQFLDPRYKHQNAPAFCVDVAIKDGKGKITGYLHYKVPWICVNFGVKKPTMTHQKPTSRHKPKKPKGNGGCTINQVNSPGAAASCNGPATGGNCNTNVNGSQNNTNTCSYVNVSCGIYSANFSGSDTAKLKQQVDAWAQEWCNNTTPTTTTSSTPPTTTTSTPCKPGQTFDKQSGKCLQSKDPGKLPPPPAGNPGGGTTPPGGNPGPPAPAPAPGCDPTTDPNGCTGVGPS